MGSDCDVVIVGGGPVGLVLAGEMGRSGLRCCLLERGDGIIGQPKMDGVGLRTMEFCRRWGIVADVEASAYNRAYPQDNVYLTALTGWEIGRQPMPSMQDDVPPAESPQKRERCPQNMFDPILQRFAARHDTVALRYEHEFLRFEQDLDGVTTTVRNRADGSETNIRSRFLVGCDGGRSAVRAQLGIGMQGRGVLTHTTNFIFRCRDFNALHDKAPGYRYMFVGPTGVWATIVAIDGRDSWRMSIIGNAQERRTYTETELKAFAHQAVGRTFDLDIVSVLRWTRIEQVADRYGAGRVFLAGDACHLTSPTGGLGMNTGIGDAVDLAWKLTAQVEGWGGPGLLDSYTIERRPVAHRITRFSTSNLEVMQRVPHTDAVFEDSAAGAEARRTVGAGLAEGLRKEWFSMNMHLGNRYVGSPVCLYDEPESQAEIEADFADAVTYRPSTRPGCRAPHVWLADGRSTLDLYGSGFVLVSEAARAKEAAPLLDAAAGRGVPIRSFAADEPKLRAAHERAHVLVRPDGHVAWRGNALPNDVDGLAATIAGHA